MNHKQYTIFLVVILTGYYAANKATANNKHEAEIVFTTIYNKKLWGENPGTVSGSGSTLTQTGVIRTILPDLFNNLSIGSLLDAGCGDFNWMKEIDLSKYNYIGVDIVHELIAQNNKNYANEHRTFKQLNIITDNLPKVDLIVCRDVFLHCPNATIIEILKNFKKSGSMYLLASFYPNYNPVNGDIPFGDWWRAIDLTQEPFKLPCPLVIIHEKATDACGENRAKSLGLWLLSSIGL